MFRWELGPNLAMRRRPPLQQGTRLLRFRLSRYMCGPDLHRVSDSQPLEIAHNIADRYPNTITDPFAHAITNNLSNYVANEEPDKFTDHKPYY
mmetsp:Transcript_11474/g.23866  ORF Transcript_11474/g.23866 Transcript_11474/m.23866 type:complete len:93 (+) Transcript_11474:285-563(+)